MSTMKYVNPPDSFLQDELGKFCHVFRCKYFKVQGKKDNLKGHSILMSFRHGLGDYYRFQETQDVLNKIVY